MSTQSDAEVVTSAQVDGAPGTPSCEPPDVREFAYKRVALWTGQEELTSPKTKAKLLALVRELPLSLAVDGFEATFALLASKRGDPAAKAVCEAFGERLGLPSAHPSGLDVLDELMELQASHDTRASKMRRADLLRLADELKYFADALLVNAASTRTASDPASVAETGASS